MKILMPVRTVAPWGGLHEWAMTAAVDLISRGHEVVVAGAVGKFKDTMVSRGVDFIDIDWADWSQSVDECLNHSQWDRIFSHGPLARNLAIRVGLSANVPVYHMIHGAYLDFADSWSPLVEKIIVASPSIQDFVIRVGKVEPWKVRVVPNGAPQWVFELPYVTYADKLEQAELTVLTAARLAPDKIQQINPTIDLVSSIANRHKDHQVILEVLGDGPSRYEFESRFNDGLGLLSNVRVNFVGWIDHDDVPERLNRAYASCVAGMGATRSLAAGCLTVAAGAQGNLGLQVGSNLAAGLWSNFGDHGCPRFEASPLTIDLEKMYVDGSYDVVVHRAREACHFQRNERLVRDTLFDALDLPTSAK